MAIDEQKQDAPSKQELIKAKRQRRREKKKEKKKAQETPADIKKEELDVCPRLHWLRYSLRLILTFSGQTGRQEN